MKSTLDIIIPVKFPSNHLHNVRAILNELPQEVKVKYVLDCQTDCQINMKNMDLKIHEQIITGRFGSPGLARNAGLNQCKSTYVIFWDVDDEPDLNPTLKLLSKVVSNNGDVGIGNWAFSDSRYKPRGISPFSVGSSPGIWRCIFRREFIKELTFSPYRWGEDQLFVAEVLAMKPTIVTSQEIVYLYRRNSQGSLTSNHSLVIDLQNSLAKLVHLADNTTGNIGLIIEIMIFRQILTIFKYGELKFAAIALSDFFRKHNKKRISTNLMQVFNKDMRSWS